MAASLPSRDTTIERQAEGWMNDPYEHFGYHNTRIHSLPREEVEAVQLAAMNLRLEERRGQIKMLEKLADAQGIRQIDSLDDMAPLLMPHDVYKSYPVSLLAKQQFGKLNTWLSRLTRYDPTGVDVSGCDSIDSWLTKLRDQTPLDVATSSGSTGTCSFFPKSKRDYRLSMMGLRVQLAQKFGEDPKPGDHRGQDPRDHSAVSRWPCLDRRFREILRRDLCQGRPELLAHRLQLQDQLRSHVARGAPARGGRQGRREQGRRAALAPCASRGMGAGAEGHAGAAARFRQPHDQAAAGTARLRHEHLQSALCRGQARPGRRTFRRLCAGLGVHGRRRRQGRSPARRSRGSHLQVLQHQAHDLLLRHDRDEQLLGAVRS